MSTQLGFLDNTSSSFPFYPPPIVSAAVFIRKMRGHSQSSLIADSHGNLYVLKMASDSLPLRCLANELIGTGLCHTLGLPAPACCFVQVDDQFIDRYPDAWHKKAGRVNRPAAGIHYGTIFIGSTEGVGRPLDLLPRTPAYVVDNCEQFYRMYLFDVWANHMDCRQNVYVGDLKRRYFSTVFIDNGLLFGGAQWLFDDLQAQAMYRKSDLGQVEWCGGDLSPCLEHFKSLIPERLRQLIGIVPPEWCADSMGRLEDILLQRLASIKELVQPFTPRVAGS